MKIKLLQCVLALTASSCVIASAALAQVFPSRIVTMVVPYPAGGQSDHVARTIQPELTKQLGHQVIVDNVSGVGGALGIQKALQAAADGHTLVLASPSDLILAPLTMQVVRHKPEDFRLAGVLINTPLVMLTRPDFNAKNFDELVAGAKKPGAKELSYGSPGYGSLYHLAGEIFARKSGIKMLHVPYKGGAPMVTDLMGGMIDVVFLPVSGNIPALIRESKVKAYGVTSRQPHPLLPNVPALAARIDFEGFDLDVWAGVLVPKGTSDAVVQRLNQAINAALANPDVRKIYESTGNQVGNPMTPVELSKFYTAEIVRHQRLVRETKLQPQ